MGRSLVAERLRNLVTRLMHGPEAAQAVVFARVLLRGADAPEGLGDEATAALVASAFRFFAAPGPDLRVRVFVPTYAHEGWDAPVTVIETIMGDRPFVVDTVRERLRAAGCETLTFLHPILTVGRDPTGRLELVAPPEEAGAHESFLHIEVPALDDAARARLADDIRAGLEAVRLVTDDFVAMVARAHVLAGELEAAGRTRPAQAAADAAAVGDLLRWLVDGGFVFLGYREYEVAAGGTALVSRPGTSLGLLRADDHGVDEPATADGRLLAVSKTLAAAPVHRRACMDDLVVRELDTDGRVTGARRFVGLFTSKAYAEEAAELPLLRRLLRQVLAAEQVVPGSHDHKEIVAIFNALPKPVLFAGTPADIREQIQSVRAAARTDEIVVTVRPPAAGGRVPVLVVLPRDRFSSDAQERVREAVAAYVGGAVVDEHLILGDADRVLLHLTMAPALDAAAPADTGALEATIRAIVRTWDEGLRDELIARYGEDAGQRLVARYAGAFPGDYRAAVSVARAAVDVERFERVQHDACMQVALHDDADGATTALQLYRADAPLVLSECVAMLEHLGLRALAEDQVRVALPEGRLLFVQTFRIQDRRQQRLDVAAVGARLANALVAIHDERTQNDVLNRLVVEAGLDWRAVDCLRAYGAYAVQAGLGGREAVLATLADHPEPARLLFACFAGRFRPGGPSEPGAEPPAARFLASLDAVQSLREDRLLRALLELVEATVRTNFFAPGPPRAYIALKLHSAGLMFLPTPRPLYEIFVQGPGMEGVHLRGGKISRGGIRWSDRPDDFRTEILGLMKTQTVKNAVIVPTGAKGGFVVKGRRDPEAVIAAYTTLIRGLLDLTDNLVAGRVHAPADLVVHDDDDPYLVVAADKGTATFSDTANGIAAEYGFWLGDAFASGGSNGYDHKKLGITARGAWECVRTHGRALGVDADTAPLAVAGIGDMGGDVFGNGLLRSPHVRLRAAFNHRHVFLDPEPDPARSFAERARLFAAGLGWEAYDTAVLSPGGMVVARAAKRVTVSPEVRALLGLGDDAVSGERLVHAVLGLDVDVLFNGGIGTYVGSSQETDADIRDAVNDQVRVRANALRARMVAEGGNLGLTPRARIEYALAGGRVNTDAVDNSAGVDMSDHEVNLKICLQAAIEHGALTPRERNALLAEVTPDVVERVLAHNRAQSELLGVDELRSRTRLADFRDLMAELERVVGLDRSLEVLPDRDALRARRPTFLGLTRPELAVLMAYTKISLQRALLASELADDTLFAHHLTHYFPDGVAARFPAAIAAHPLRREIVATEVVNALVDGLGMTFVARVARDTGASTVAVVRAWGIAWSLIGAAELVAAGRGVGGSAEAQTVCALALERPAERVTKWLLANGDPARPAVELLADLAPGLGRVRDRLPEWLVGAEAQAFAKQVADLEMSGLPSPLARAVAAAGWLAGALDVVTVARQQGNDLEATAARYYGLGRQLDFAWLWGRLGEAGEDDRWQQRAVEGLVTDVLRARRRLAHLTPEALPVHALEAIEALVRDVRALPRPSLAALHVVVHELRLLAETASPTPL